MHRNENRYLCDEFTHLSSNSEGLCYSVQGASLEGSMCRSGVHEADGQQGLTYVSDAELSTWAAQQVLLSIVLCQPQPTGERILPNSVVLLQLTETRYDFGQDIEQYFLILFKTPRCVASVKCDIFLYISDSLECREAAEVYRRKCNLLHLLFFWSSTYIYVKLHHVIWAQNAGDECFRVSALCSLCLHCSLDTSWVEYFRLDSRACNIQDIHV